MKKIISLAFVLIIALPFALAEDNSTPIGLIKNFSNGSQEIVLYSRNPVSINATAILGDDTFSVIQDNIDTLNRRMDNLEIKVNNRNTPNMGIYDYLSIINLVLLIVLFVFVILKFRKPKEAQIQ